MVVYLITNLINGKQYVGQTTQALEERWRLHLSERSGCLALKSAIDKYGKDNFIIEPLMSCNSLEELDKSESSAIQSLNTLSPAGYNLTTGGERPSFSAESRLKMSKSGKVRKSISSDTRNKLSERMKGEKNHNFGKKFSADYRKKLSVSRAGKSPRKGHKILCCQSGRIYSSLSEASKDLSINVGYLHQILNGKRKSAKGLTFVKVLR